MSLRRYTSEFLGSAALLATVVGSGIMAERLAQGNLAVALLANAGATAAMLYVLITTLGPISGAHFNPAVTLVMRLRGEIDNRSAAGYVVVQVAGAVAGTLLAHGMFELNLLQPGIHTRSGVAQSLSEGVATFGLVATILLGAKVRAASLPALVASYIFAAYWFTASTSFANPAVTLARALTQTFSGIRPLDAPAFIAAQLAGAVLALMAITALTQERSPQSNLPQSKPPR